MYICVQVLCQSRKDVLAVAVSSLGGALPLLKSDLHALQNSLRPMSPEFLYSHFAFANKSPVTQSFIMRYVNEAVNYITAWARSVICMLSVSGHQNPRGYLQIRLGCEKSSNAATHDCHLFD